MKTAPPANKKKIVHSHSDHDLRLERRWNRKLSAAQSNPQSSPLARSEDCRHDDRKKPLRNDDREVVEDEDYMKFLESIEGYDHDGINHYSIRKDRKEKEEDEYTADLIGIAGKIIQYEAPRQEEVGISLEQPISCEEICEGKFTPSKLLENSYNDEIVMKGKLRYTSGSEYREKLMDILRKPFDEKEYEELMHEISRRKLKQRHKELRGRIIIYSEDRPGKSYLDHHTDLARKIDLVRSDYPKVLNLMRGFFFWLKNVSHEGAFCPWLDSSCSDSEMSILEHEDVLFLDYDTQFS